MTQVILHVSGWFQVVTLQFAKRVLYHMGMGTVRKDADHLEVFSGLGMGMSPAKDAKLLTQLTVDEGVYSDCMDGTYDIVCESTILGINRPWDELVDAERFFALLAQRVDPEFKPEASPFHGSGRTQRHYMEQWQAVLKRVGKFDEVEFVD